MMTGGKVILTYKRQRPLHWIAYKRKRPPSKNNFSQVNKCPDKSAECENYNVSTKAEKQDESTTGSRSECPNGPAEGEKQEESTEGNRMESTRNSVPTTGKKQEELTEGNRSECPAKDDEHAHEGKRQYSGCIKQKNCLVSAGKASRAEGNSLFALDIGPLAADSHTVLETSPRKSFSQKASGDQLSTDFNTLGESNSIQEASYSYVNSGSACDVRSTMTYLDPFSANCNFVTDSHQVCLTSSIREDCTSNYRITSESDNLSVKETGFPVEDKSSSWCANATLQSKLGSPLITFYRRCKRKKDVDGLHAQNNLQVGDTLTFKGAESAGFASVEEATPPEADSKHILVITNPSEKNLNRRPAFDACHEKMASGDVEYSCGSRSSPETGNVKQAESKLENTPQDNQSIVEVIPQNSVGVDLQEGPTSCSGNLSNDSAGDPSHEPVLYNGHTTVGKESQSLSNDDLNMIRMTKEIPSSRSSVLSLDLSVTVPGSHEIADSGLASVFDELPLCSSLNSHSGSHTTLFKDESPVNKGLGLLHERVGERHSLHQAQVLENGCLSEDAVRHMYNGFASSPIFESGKNCLQLFPDNRTDATFQPKKMGQNITARADSEKTVSPFESRCQAGPAATKSSLFLGLFLPMELMNDGHERSSTSSQWLNVGIQSKEFSQDTVPMFVPDQASPHWRHKMVLDTVVSTVKMPKRKRGGCLDLYDSPRMWSDEELDSLWVGIRRYGRGNWEVMLRDPRLLFSPWRTPRDLAEQWEEEQFKLFNTMPSFQSRGRHLGSANIFRDSVDGVWITKNGKENLADDVQLSLGDVYSQHNGSFQMRSLNCFDAQNNAPQQLQKAVTNTRTMYSCRGNCRRAVRQKNAMLDVGCSFRSNQSTSMATGGNLPHWLREIFSIPLRSPQTVLPSDTSSVRHVEMQGVMKPVLDAKEIHQGPIKQISTKRTIVERIGEQTGAGAYDGILSELGHHKTEQEQYPGNEQDLIIIDSDGSSEETISDDRSTKV